MQYDLTRNVPQYIQERYNNIPEHIRDLSEDDLESYFKPKIALYQIKNRIWDEISKKQRDPNRKITLASIYSGICSDVTLSKYMDNNYILAWFMTPMASYDAIANAVLAKATKRYEDLISIDIMVTKKKKNSDGDFEYYQTVDPKKADILLKTIQNIEDRVLGTAVQKNINLSGDLDKTDSNIKVDFNIEEVNKRIKELEGKLSEHKADECDLEEAIIVGKTSEECN